MKHLDRAFHRLKYRLYDILEHTSPDNEMSHRFNMFITLLISLNVLAVVLQTVVEIEVEFRRFFFWFEVVSVAIYTVEYILRLWTCNVNPSFQGRFGRLRFALTPLALVDLFAVVPFYLPLFASLDLRFLRGIRLARLFILFKVARYSDSMRTIISVVRRIKDELLVSVFVTFVLLVVASSLMYFIEHDAQPHIFSSIPASMWWGVATLTTVGYGDVYPITPLGKFLAAIVAFLGIGIFALPAGMISSSFIEEVQAKQKRQFHCPRCGFGTHTHLEH